MTLKLIDEVYLYTSSLPEDAVLTRDLVAWFDHSDIPYTHLSHGARQVCLDALNTWWQTDEDTGVKQEPLTDFPFVVYTEVHSDKRVSYLPRKYILGKDIIEQMPSLYALGR